MADLSWGGYRNGQIPLSAMTMVRNELFRSDAAAQLLLFEAAFEKEFGHQFVIAEGYRTLTRQRKVWGERQAFLLGVGPWAPVAAVVGTSKHGWGVAGDFWSRIDQFGTAEHNWAVKNGPRFGWYWGSTPSEAWHFEFPHAFGSFASSVIIPISNTITLPKATVEKLQSDLKRLGIAVDVDGVYGKGTTAAVKAYQAQKSLVVDGIAGGTTLKSISDAIATLDAKEAAAAVAAKLAKESSQMFTLIWDDEKNQSGYLATSLGIIGIGDRAGLTGRQVFTLLQRLRDGQRNGTEPKFNKQEIAILNQLFEELARRAIG